MPSTFDFATPLRIDLDGNQSYSIVFGDLGTVSEHMRQAGLRPGRCLVVTDENVNNLYARTVEDALRRDGWQPKIEVVQPGEKTKSHAFLHDIYGVALEWGIDRKTPIVALGGGVVGDLAGFAAATLLRGLPLVQIPTTLIAQVDSAIGGKTGINHSIGKNLIGAFHQPRLVYSDLDTLQSLPVREWTSGLAEVVKHALIADPILFDFLEDNWGSILDREPSIVGRMVYAATRVKTQVVSQDVNEQGLRAILNFGHTFGHAIEREAGYGQFTHGEAVAVGMLAALNLSGSLNASLEAKRGMRLVRQIPIQGDLRALSVSKLMQAMYVDKKVEAGMLRLVLLKNIGEAYVTSDVASSAIELAWRHILAD